jgi:hypothetical protein
VAPRPLLTLALAALGILASASEARAFCRSTACTGDCPRDENGCKTTGEPLSWKGVCVGFSLQKDGSVNIPPGELRAAVQDSFAAWADIDCGGGQLASIGIGELDDVSCHHAEYDKGGPNANAILVQDTKWDYHGPDDTLAKTTVTFDAKTGEILDADIEINHAYNEITTSDAKVVYDLRSILTHEIGHFLGLDHSADPAATMYADYSPGSVEERTLEDDDRAGLCAVYPPDRKGVCDSTPRGGLGDACADDPATDKAAGCSLATSPSAPNGTGMLLAFVAAGLVWKRRRVARRLLVGMRGRHATTCEIFSPRRHGGHEASLSFVGPRPCSGKYKIFSVALCVPRVSVVKRPGRSPLPPSSKPIAARICSG